MMVKKRPMRRLAARPTLDAALMARLQGKTGAILEKATIEERRVIARASFNSARQANWFDPVVVALRSMSGNGELCMYCSANEPSQVEHFRPINSSPELAFSYPNYLWTCDICNRTFKRSQFPPESGPGAMILNPLDENVWDYFFLDDTRGQLVPRIDEQTGEPLARATSTLEIVGLDRETLRKRRNSRLRNLKKLVDRLIAQLAEADITVAHAREQANELIHDPLQADVADFFMRGPGREKEPFRTLFLAIGEV
jgi:uncharacterized protein (TIGR02646 family)